MVNLNVISKYVGSSGEYERLFTAWINTNPVDLITTWEFHFSTLLPY